MRILSCIVALKMMKQRLTSDTLISPRNTSIAPVITQSGQVVYTLIVPPRVETEAGVYRRLNHLCNWCKSYWCIIRSQIISRGIFHATVFLFVYFYWICKCNGSNNDNNKFLIHQTNTNGRENVEIYVKCLGGNLYILTKANARN